MNVSRTRRRLVECRRYQQKTMGRPFTMSVWSLSPRHGESRRALVAQRRLAARKFRLGWESIEFAYPRPYESDCGGWTLSSPPCGGCARCCADQDAYWLSRFFSARRAADVMLRDMAY